MPEQPPCPTGIRHRLSATERRDQIVQAAADVFVARGYQGASLEDIAAHAGITRPLIYHYFRDKDALYLEVLTQARTSLDAAIIGGVPTGASPEEQLRGGIAGYFQFVQDNMHLWELLFGGGTAVAGSVATEAMRQRFETSEKIALLVSAAAPEEPALRANAYAHAISGAGEALTRWWQRHPEVTLEEMVELHMDTVWRGLGPVLDSLR